MTLEEWLETFEPINRPYVDIDPTFGTVRIDGDMTRDELTTLARIVQEES